MGETIERGEMLAHLLEIMAQAGTVLDPTNTMSGNVTLDQLGLIPYFVAKHRAEANHPSTKVAMDRYYGYGLYEIDGGSIGDDGTYSFPEDADLKPLAAYKVPEGTMYQYQYAIVAIPEAEGGYFVTRMD
jgi:hypothetical protein